jgi:hypothetical protein
MSASGRRQDAGGENGRDFAQPFVGSHAGGVNIGSHGTSPWGSAHSDLRGAAGRLSGRNGREASTYRPLQVALELTHRGADGKRVGNSERGGNQRLREFWRESFGDRGEPSRFLSDPDSSLSEWRVFGRGADRRNPLQERRKTQNAEGQCSRRFSVTRLYPPLDADGRSSPTRTLFVTKCA